MSFNNDLLIKNNPADLILLATALKYDGIENSVTILFNSSEDWTSTTGDKEKISTLGYWGCMLLIWLESDINIKSLSLEYYQIVDGKSQELGKLRPFYRDGKRFKKAFLNRDGDMTFFENDEM